MADLTPRSDKAGDEPIYRFVLAKKWQEIQSYNELYRLCYISIAVKIVWMT